MADEQTGFVTDITCKLCGKVLQRDFEMWHAGGGTYHARLGKMHMCENGEGKKYIV